MRIKLSFLCFVVVSSLICSIGNANAASSLEDQEKALNIIADFADRICSNIRLEGSGSAVELNGEAKAELKGLFKKFANLGMGGTGKFEETAWSGVLQKDIAAILQKNVDCKLKIVDLLKDKVTSTKQEDSIPHAENKAGDKKTSSGNLVVNGDFSAHWSEGWKKNVSDRTKGSLHVETVQSSNDPSDQLLHLHLEGQGAGWIEQKAYLPDGKGIKNMFVEFEMKTATETNGFNLGEPIEAFFGLQFTDKDGNNLGQINFSAGKKSDFEDTGMYGVPSSLKSNNSRCMIKTNPQYHSMKENLYNKYIDCFSPNGIDKIKSIDMVAYLQASRSNQTADIYLDNIKIYYKD
jgi:hypothetical protein